MRTEQEERNVASTFYGRQSIELQFNISWQSALSDHPHALYLCVVQHNTEYCQIKRRRSNLELKSTPRPQRR